MTNFDALLKTRFKSLKYRKGKIATFATTLCLFLVMNILFLVIVMMNGLDEKPSQDGSLTPISMMASIFELMNTIIVLCYTSITVSLIYKDEVSHNILGMEQRQGYSEKDTFSSRLVEYISEVAIFYLVIVIFNIIFFGPLTNFDKSVVGYLGYYSFFISSLGWYAIFIVITSAIAILFNSFASEGASVSVTLLFGLIIAVVGMLGMMIYASAMVNQQTGEVINQYKDGKFTAIECIYNPALQWGFMFDGFNYGEGKVIDFFVSTVQSGSNTPGLDAAGQRIVFPEVIYLIYFIFNSLLIFASYWIWKKTSRA